MTTLPYMTAITQIPIPEYSDTVFGVYNMFRILNAGEYEFVLMEDDVYVVSYFTIQENAFAFVEEMVRIL